MTTDTTVPPAEPPLASEDAYGVAPVRGTWRQYVAAARVLLALTVLLGVGYPLLVTGIAQLPGLRDKAGGSLAHDAAGRVIGSSLLAQGFVDAKGDPLKEWFQPRPSAAGKDGWDGTSSGASNLGPTNPDLVKSIHDRKAAIAAFDSVPGHPVAPDQVPPDAVTASGSGLDPDISPAYARQQAYRVAAARGLDPTRVLTLIDQHTQGRDLGFIGEPRVDVLQLDLALQRLRP